MPCLYSFSCHSLSTSIMPSPSSYVFATASASITMATTIHLIIVPSGTIHFAALVLFLLSCFAIFLDGNSSFLSKVYIIVTHSSLLLITTFVGASTSVLTVFISIHSFMLFDYTFHPSIISYVSKSQFKFSNLYHHIYGVYHLSNKHYQGYPLPFICPFHEYPLPYSGISVFTNPPYHFDGP